MAEQKIKVPEGMLDAVIPLDVSYYRTREARHKILEVALRWLSEHPIVPDDEQMGSMPNHVMTGTGRWCGRELIVEWQRRMFLAPEPDPDEPIKDLTVSEQDEKEGYYRPSEFNRRVREAYRRGREEAR
jgi:hypothetical protein